MVIERTDKEIIFRLPKDFDIEYLQRIKDMIEFKMLVSKSKATEEQIEEFAEEVKDNWWKQNKHRFIK